jgi:uncharacterized protein (UPF0335 family)
MEEDKKDLWRRKAELDAKWDKLMEHLNELKESGRLSVEEIERLEEEFLKIQKEYWRLMAELRKRS